MTTAQPLEGGNSQPPARPAAPQAARAHARARRLGRGWVLLAPAILLVTPHPAAAKVKKVKWRPDGPTPTIKVLTMPDGGRRVEPPEVTFPVHLEQDCSVGQDAEEAFMRLGKANYYRHWIEASNGGAVQFFRRDGGRWGDRSSYAVRASELHPVEQCEEREQSGYTGPGRYEIAARTTASYVVKCVGTGRDEWKQHTGSLAYTLLCVPSSSTKPIDGSSAPQAKGSGKEPSRVRAGQPTRTSGDTSPPVREARSSPAPRTSATTTSGGGSPRVRRAEPGSSADEPQRVGDPSRGADLSIAEIQDVPGEPSKLRVKIRNDGVVHSDATNLKVFYRRSGQQLVEGTPVPSIRPRSSVWLVVSAPGRIAAAQTVSLKVDDPDRVSESDEGNNSYRYK